MINAEQLGISLIAYFLGSISITNILYPSQIKRYISKQDIVKTEHITKCFDFLKAILLGIWLKYTIRSGIFLYLYLIIFLVGHHFSIHRKFKNNKSFYTCLGLITFLDIEKLILFLFSFYVPLIFIKRKVILVIFALLTTFIFSFAKQDLPYETLLIFSMLILNIYSYAKNIEKLVLFTRDRSFKIS